MELEYKDIRLVKIGPQFCLDTLYANDDYDTPFVIETKYGTLHTVTLVWSQGWKNNYTFEGPADIFYLSDIAYIEVR